MDSGFIKRVYRTSTGAWAFALLWCAALKSVPVAIGITIGFGISIGSMMVLERVVKSVFVPSQANQPKRGIKRLLVIAAIKYAIIGAILWAALRSGWASPIGLVIGIGLPYMIIFLKALGIAMSPGQGFDRRS